MNWIFFTFIIVTASLCSLGQVAAPFTPGIDNFKDFAFEVELDKTNYVIGEPVSIRFTLRNRTDETRKTYEPSFLQESKLKVRLNGRSDVYFPLAVGGKPIRSLSSVRSGDALTGDDILASPLTAAYFPEPGKYQIKFVLRDASGNKEIESNMVQISFENPAGIDKAAFEFMQAHKQYFGQSSWTDDQQEGFSLLQRFVIDYGQSVYGELAIVSLGSIYLSRGELESAKQQFEKLDDSKSSVVVRHAKRSLAEIKLRQQAKDKDLP
jgi:hypothetical protein